MMMLRITALLVLALASSTAQPSAPAPSTASTRCSTCPAAPSGDARTLNLTVLVETDVAQFYSYTSEGAILVYFVTRAIFSQAPAQLQLADFDIEDGSVLEIVAENVCTQFLLKGVVQQKEGWLHNTTEVKVSVKEGATTTCNGESFSSASAFSASRNGLLSRPIGSMYVPNVAYTAAGPITSAATNYIRLAFSEAILGLDITNFNISLTPAPDTLVAAPNTSSRKLMQAAAPSVLQNCVPAYKSQAVPAVKNSTQFYNVFITIPDCFYGLVNVQFKGQVTNAAGDQSLPIKAVGYNRVASNIPVQGLSAYETLPALGQNLLSTCS